MDDTQQQQSQQPQQANPMDDVLSSMNDVAGMTPPPAPVMPEVSAPAGSMPAEGAMPASAPGAPVSEEDYSYAEDVLNEILDSLDRIEAKLEAMEKKMG